SSAMRSMMAMASSSQRDNSRSAWSVSVSRGRGGGLFGLGSFVHSGKSGERGGLASPPLPPPIGHPGGVAISIFPLDDHELVRRGIRDLLWTEEDMTVVGQASNAAEALELIPQTKPDVAVLDVRLGEGRDEPNGIEVCRDIRSHHPEVACVMLTSFAD